MKFLTIIVFTIIVWSTFFIGTADACNKEQEFDKLVEMIYHEAKGESFHGKLAVATVAVERKYSRKFPNNLCMVINQKHQFSYFWDGIKEVFEDDRALKESQLVAYCVVYNECSHRLVRGAMWYYACDGLFRIEPPYWTKYFRFVAKIDNHCFYG